MRIIGGTYKGKIIKVANGLPVRPTTDFAKEGLFNVLSNRFDLSEFKVLDLFSGTGHISLEFASRGAQQITAVDSHIRCVSFLSGINKELNLNIAVVKSDVFQFLKSATGTFDIIFADPPYDLPNIPEIHKLVFERNLLGESGLLIIEHGPKTKLEDLPGFAKHKKYGNVNFSFFENIIQSQ